MEKTLKEIMADNLIKQLKKANKTQTMMANDLNLPQMTVSNWVKGKTYPRPDKIQLMAEYFNVRRTDLTEEEVNNIYPHEGFTMKIPVLGTISCGDPITAEENVIDYHYETFTTKPNGELFCLHTTGDSMSPTIPTNSTVLFKKQVEVENGEIAAVLLNGSSEATLKRVKKQGETILLMADNPSYDPIIVDESYPARIIGKAIRFTTNL